METNQISHIMTRDVISVEPECLLKEAVSIMRQRKVSFLVVAINRKPLGVLSERDIVRLASQQADPEQLQIKDVMTSPVITIDEATNIFQVYDILNSKRIRHIVVVDEAGLMTGLTTLTNILGGLSIEYFIELKQVENIMAHNICTLSPDDLVQQALELMARKRISCVIISLDGKPVGIITERDITRLYGSGLASDTRLASVMTQPVRTVDAGTFIPQANQILRDEKLRHLVVVDASGDLCGLVSQSDITRRIEDHYVGYLRSLVKQQGEELQYEHARFSILFEQNPNAVVSCDVHGNIVDINRAYTLLSGYEQSDMVGKPLESFIHPDDVLCATQSLKKASDREACHVEFRLLNKSGQFTDVFNSFLPIYVDHSLHRIYSVMHDISDRKKADKQIQQAEKKVQLLAKAVEAAADSVVITDRNGTIEFVNAAFTRITGYSSDEAIGNKPSILKSGEQDEQFYAQLWGTITKGETWHSRLVDRRKNGDFFPADLAISPVCNADGEITHFVGIKRDLTERETLESQFRQAQKMEAIGTLVGGIAHDFNNMLAGMTGNVFLTKQQTRDMPDVLIKLDNIEQLAFRASNMIEQLLTFARKDRVSIKAIPLPSYIKETCKLLRPSIPENIAMHVDVCSEALQIKGDATLLHQVLMNLVSNACDAVEDVDDPCITVRLEAFHADAAFVKNRAHFNTGVFAHLSVADNGCGVPQHQVEHLFEPFFTTKEQGKGTGLGLAMVFGAVKTHHGFVEVESMEGEGATFHIYFPLLKSEHMDIIAAPLQHTEAMGHGELILLVDDEAYIVETGQEVLESLGYRVLVARNGQQAVDIFNAHAEEIALVILDVVMPLMSGGKAAQLIRQQHPQVKIIFSTGYDKNTHTELAGETVLGKPFAIKAMSHLIRRNLDT